MKNSHIRIIGLYLCIYALFSCTKEIKDDLIIPFVIELEETNIASFAKVPKSTVFKIRGIKSDYQFKYAVTKGIGHFVFEGDIVEENEFINLPEGNSFTIDYVGMEDGEHQVTLDIKDASGNNKQALLVYNVVDASFNLEILAAPISAYVGGSINLNLNITETVPASYNVSYTFVNTDNDLSGAGKIYVNDEVLPPGQSISIEEAGEFVWQFEGVTLGNVDILLEVESDLGVIHQETIQIAVTEIPDFTFTAQPVIMNDQRPITNSSVEINFKLEEIIGVSLYTVVYTTSNEGSFMYDGISYVSGDEIPILPGTSTATYTGAVAGDHMLAFKVSNANNIPITKEEEFLIAFMDPDVVAPVIALNGPNEVRVRVGTSYNDPVSASDNVDGDITSGIVFGGNYTGTDMLGTFSRTYNVKDRAGNMAEEISRKIIVIDDVAPVITLKGNNPLPIAKFSIYTDPGVNVSDNYDTMNNIVVTQSGTVDTSTLGSYSITFTAEDASGNKSLVSRTVQVKSAVATISPENVTGKVPFAVTFNTFDSAAGGIILEATWDFGDGSPILKLDEEDPVTHTFTRIGTYTVSVEIIDEFGATDETSTTVIVTN